MRHTHPPHAGGLHRDNASFGILESDAFCGGNTQLLRRLQVDVRRRLAVGDLVSGHHDAKPMPEAGPVRITLPAGGLVYALLVLKHRASALLVTLAAVALATAIALWAEPTAKLVETVVLGQASVLLIFAAGLAALIYLCVSGRAL